jgi:hypothetical protein
VGIRTSDPLSMFRRRISYPPQIHASIFHFFDIIYTTFILRRMFGTTTSSTEFFVMQASAVTMFRKCRG